MSKIDLLKKLNKAISGEKIDFSAFDSEVSKLKASLTETVNIQTIDDVGRKLKQFQSKIDFTPLLTEIEKIRNIFTDKAKELEGSIKDKVSQAFIEEDVAKKADLDNEVSTLKDALTTLTSSRLKDLENLTQSINDAKSVSEKLGETLKTLSTKEESAQSVKDIQTLIDTTRKELIDRISKFGGGSIPQQVFIGSTDALTRYRDISIKAGTNMSITITNNNTTKKAEITFNASGGGGGVNFETPVGIIDDSNLTFSVSNTPAYINVNGLIYTTGVGIFASYSAPNITLTVPVGTGGFIISAY